MSLLERPRLAGRATRRPGALPAAALALLAASLVAFVGAPPAHAQPEAPGYSTKELVGPNPLMKSTGIVIYRDEDEHFLYSADGLRNTIFRVNLDTREVDRIAHDFEPAAKQLITPHTLEIDGDGRLYVTEYGTQTVRRLDREGRDPRVVIAAGAGSSQRDRECGCDVVTGTSGIAFNSQGRLFVGENVHDRDFTGAIWEVDPEGVVPAREIARGRWLVEEISFAPERPELAYVTDVNAGAIHVLNVGSGKVERQLTGFDKPWGLEYDSFAGRDRLLVAEMRGNVWEVDPETGERELLARMERPGLGPIGIDPGDGTVYVSNGLYGGLYRLDERGRKLVPVLAEGEFAIPTLLNEAPADAALPAGSIWVGDFTSISTLTPEGEVSRILNFQADDYDSGNPDDPHWMTTSALQADERSVYFGERQFFRDVITRLDLSTGERVAITEPNAVQNPYHLRPGPDGDLLLTDVPNALGDLPLSRGRLLRLDSATGEIVATIADGLRTPGGLRYDDESGTAYVAEVATGAVWAIEVDGCALPPVCERRLVADGLDTPEGLDLDGTGGLVVVEGDGERRLLRIDLATGDERVIASGLPTKLRGPLPKPLPFDWLADVLVRDNGEIVVTAPADASVLAFRPKG